ncbi:SDR family oxidoreductase [Kitasatospora sp. NPDC101801]|uniref:SDR family oxidoreductase n=1 Tax=Kitasatospora sp. NPDC101801 TaxID=3364103 RepID=UPI00380148C5
MRALTRRAELPVGEGLEWVRGDLLSGDGLATAFAGVRAVIHCATDIRHPKNDLPGIERLLAAARTAGVGHVVNISIVGVDRIPYFYYRIKLAGERLLADSGIGWSNLRATQFPTLLDSAFGVPSRLPGLLLVPSGTVCQPVDQREVAERLAELAQGAPVGQAPELGGPTVYPAERLAGSWLAAAGKRRRVPAVRVRDGPGPASAAAR